MKTIDLEEMKQQVELNGFYKVENFFDENDIRYMKSERDSILFEYHESLVKKRIFYRREDSKNRQGDAVMVTNGNTSLPHLKLLPRGIVSVSLQVYNDMISKLTGIEVSKNSRAMFNSQQYFSGSLPVFDHYDAEIFQYCHQENKDTKELELMIEKALLPRYVMVIVLENENKGKGTYIREHNSKERIEIENNPGDLIIFDNIKFRHGVASLEHSRSMVGFRDFDHYPYYFEAEPEASDWEELDDDVNPGFIKEFTPEQSQIVQERFNEKWNSELYQKNLEQNPAF